MTRSTVSLSGGRGGAGGGGSQLGRPIVTSSRSCFAGRAKTSAISRNVPPIADRAFSSRTIATSDGLHLQRDQNLHVTSIIAPGVKTGPVLVLRNEPGGHRSLQLGQGEPLVLDRPAEDLPLDRKSM